MFMFLCFHQETTVQVRFPYTHEVPEKYTDYEIVLEVSVQRQNKLWLGTHCPVLAAHGKHLRAWGQVQTC